MAVLRIRQRLADVGRIESRFQQKRIVALVGMDSNPCDGDAGFFQQMHKPALFPTREGKIRVDAEDKIFLGAASREQLGKFARTRFSKQVEPLPGIEDTQEGVGVEA